MPQWEQHMGQDSSNIDSGIDLGRTVPFNGDTDKENRPDPATLDPTDSETHDDIIPNSPKKTVEPGSLRFQIDQWMEHVKANLFNQ
ncbi:uncharacterized protein LOC106646640 [Copidosoma floridanum]|uniref:uncharacterized protein LOC106646640 n=1 Tax=Copidosoma floridanum TaxID=29053 RepID=UPI0006C948DC|nr:uncharacterized protein LOC106646640 [Copidosoma floridanum]